MTRTDWLYLAGFMLIGLILLVIDAYRTAPDEGCNCPACKPPVEGAHGAYEEPGHVREKREAYVARRVLSAHDKEVAEHRKAMAGKAGVG